jgi:membrane protein DedA with SNARE-associated domain/membrane-associated phospholipid phosphatase
MRPAFETARRLLADKRVRLLVIAALAIGGYFVVKGLLPEIELQELLDDVARTLGDWTYLAVSVLAFLETGAFVGLVAPGETFVILAGAVAGVDETSVVITIALVWFSAFAGDTVSFFLGRRLGRRFVLRYGPRVRITEERFMQVEAYFGRHGGKTILIGRFIGLVRALAPFIAGSSGLRYRAFAPYSILGTGLWSAAFTLIGYFAAQSLDEVAHVAGRGTFLFGVTVAVIVTIVVAVRYLREPENRERLVREMERRRALRPLVALGRRVKPQALFIWNRLTPGELGLELTTTIAVLAVAAFVFVGYAILLEGEPGPTPGDSTALDVVRDINEPWFTDVNRAVTRLGAPYVAYPVAAVVVVALAFQRRFAAAAVVVFAMLIVFMGVDLLKEMVDRPRPPDRLAPTERSSYPSGHAANSVIYVWAAGIVAIRLGGQRLGTRLTAGGLVLVLGILLAAAIGLSRAYLRVHYLSDVNGGWGLGVAAFALCAAVAIIVTHLRQNAPSRRGEVSPVGEDRA